MSSESEEEIIELAKAYLEDSPFSKKELTEQLEFEGYQLSDVSDAVEKLSVDWKEQALRRAKGYTGGNGYCTEAEIFRLLTMAGGFTDEEAKYAVSKL